MNNDPVQFSEREKDVIELLLQGKSNKQIALALGISASTVEYHLKNVYKKLHVGSRTEAVIRLGKSIGGSAASELGKSTVELKAERADNGVQSSSTRRISMNKTVAMISGGILTVAVVTALVFVNRQAQNAEPASTAIASLAPTVAQVELSTSIPTPAPPFEDIQYIVTADDTCEVIALNFNIPVEAILERNNLSPSCKLEVGQVLLLPLSTSPVQLYEISNNPPEDFLGEWVAPDLNTANLARVSIQMQGEETYINMFGNCQPTECNFREYSPATTVDYNYDSRSGILHVTWIFDFVAMTQELTITSDGQLKVVTQNNYLDDSGRADFGMEEYFTRQ
ncbi:MAG: LysM peptidoglycan-binding domain-containing protein [Anaerolineales bacterium]|nr:LysM peptidoglycan-binding domain-containing protein [Anaerolineales bacterium]